MLKCGENYAMHLLFATLTFCHTAGLQVGSDRDSKPLNSQMASNMILYIPQDYLKAVEMVNT